MTILSFVVKNRFSQFDKVELPRVQNPQLVLKAECFWNEESTQLFY